MGASIGIGSPVNAQDNSVIVDISKCLNVQQLNDGTFDLRLLRPIKIIRETKLFKEKEERKIIIVTNIKMINLQWNINTSIVYENGEYEVPTESGAILLDAQTTWMGLSNQTPQGDCATYLFPEKPRDFNPSEKKLEGGVINNHYNQFYTNDSPKSQGNYYWLDNFLSPYEKKEIVISNIVVDTNNDNILNVRSLEDLYRLKVYLKVEATRSVIIYSTEFNMRICCEAKVVNPPPMNSSLVDYTELVSAIRVNQAISAIDARSNYIAKMNSNYSSKKYYKEIVSRNYENLTRIFVNKIIDTFASYINYEGILVRKSATFYKYQEIVEECNLNFAFEELNNDEWAITVLKPIVITYNVSRPGNWGGVFIFEIDEYWRTKLTFTTTDGWIQKNQKMCGDFGYSFNDSGGVNKYGDVIQSPPATYKGQIKGYSDPSTPFNHSIIANSEEYNVTSSCSVTPTTAGTPSWLPPPINWNVKIKDGKKLIVKKNKDDINTIDLANIYGSVYGIYEENVNSGQGLLGKTNNQWIIQKDMFINLNSTIRLRRLFFTLNEGEQINITKDITDISQYLYSAYQGEITYAIENVDDKDFNASLSGSIFRVESKESGSYKSGSCYLVARQNNYTSRVELKWEIDIEVIFHLGEVNDASNKDIVIRYSRMGDGSSRLEFNLSDSTENKLLEIIKNSNGNFSDIKQIILKTFEKEVIFKVTSSGSSTFYDIESFWIGDYDFLYRPDYSKIDDNLSLNYVGKDGQRPLKNILLPAQHRYLTVTNINLFTYLKI
jgi:hypothetical protein